MSGMIFFLWVKSIAEDCMEIFVAASIENKEEPSAEMTALCEIWPGMGVKHDYIDLNAPDAFAKYIRKHPERLVYAWLNPEQYLAALRTGLPFGFFAYDAAKKPCLCIQCFHGR